MGVPHAEVVFDQATPFSLVYGTKAMVPIEVMVPSAGLALASKIADSHNCINDIEVLSERRQSMENKWSSYQKQVSNAYNKR